MKVAHINAGNEYGGGLVHIVSLLSTLQESGLTTELIVMEEGPVAKAARLSGINVIVFEQKTRYDLRVLSRLLSYIKSNQFDLVHTHGPRANMIINLLNPFLKTKWVVTVHSNPLLDFAKKGFKGKVFERVSIKSLIKADGVIAVSNEIKSVALKIGAKDTSITTIQNGIHFSAPVSAKKDTSVFTIISAGRLHAIKNIALLLDSLSELSTSNWKLIVCGEGEEETKLREQAQNLNCLSKLDFKGWMDSDKLGRIISEADILVLPSKSEGFPVILLEAAEQEVPVIATDVGDVRELIDDQALGWLIESENKSQMTAALEEAYEDWTEEKLLIKGKRFRERALEFSLSTQSEKVIEFYNKIL